MLYLVDKKIVLYLKNVVIVLFVYVYWKQPYIKKIVNFISGQLI